MRRAIIATLIAADLLLGWAVFSLWDQLSWMRARFDLYVHTQQMEELDRPPSIGN